MSIRKEKIQFFEKTLVDFFRKAGRARLPWRKKNITAYEVWVSEIMLQQTQVVRVIAYYEKFVKRFPKVEDLAQATWEEFLPYYQGLGYYARGRNMLRTAQRVVNEYDGVFPRKRAWLQKLPGIGPYTASAIMSFAYNEEHLAWDTNLRRVIGRFFFGGKQRIIKEAVWDEKLHTPKKEMNAALMDFGSALCVARPKCEACSLRVSCRYFREQGRHETVPTLGTQKDKKIRRVDWENATAHVFLHENHRKYYSSSKKTFQPFILPAGYSTRDDIKRYFQKKYGLTLAVRPPHEKCVIGKTPTLSINAQILLGEPPFVAFSKNTRKEYNKNK